MVEEDRYQDGVAFIAGTHQRGKARAVRVVDAGSALQEILDHLQVSTGSGSTERDLGYHRLRINLGAMFFDQEA